jgi:GT2 family glycosyltransferase
LAQGPTVQDKYDISIVIPTRERLPQLARTLDALGRQELGGITAEVVIADNGSGDGSVERMRELAPDGLGYEVIVEERRGPAAARNTAVAAARSDLILFMNDDAFPADERYLAGHVEAHRELDDPWCGVVGRAAWDPALEQTPVMEWLDRSNTFFNYARFEREAPAHSAFLTLNVSLRRECLESVGGFDERFPDAAGEDIELGFRLYQRGFRLAYRPELLVLHHHWYDFPASLRRTEVAGRAMSLLWRIHGHRKDLDSPTTSPAKMALGRLVAPVAGAIEPPLWLPDRWRDTTYRVLHRAAYVRGITSKPPIPHDPLPHRDPESAPAP